MKVWQKGLGLCALVGALSAGTVHAQTTVPMATWGGNIVAVNRVFIPALEEEFKKGSGNLKLQVFPGGHRAVYRRNPDAFPPRPQTSGAARSCHGPSGAVAQSLPWPRIADSPLKKR